MIPDLQLPGAVVGFMGMHLALRTEAAAVACAGAHGHLVPA